MNVASVSFFGPTARYRYGVKGGSGWSKRRGRQRPDARFTFQPDTVGLVS